MADRSAPAKVILSFGNFELSPSERLLSLNGAPVELGARALDVLIVLASRPNEVVGKQALIAAVWPDVTVEEGSLRFHIASLRKALGDGKDGARYIATLSGRGYCFVAPVTQSTGADTGIATAAAYSPNATFLPARLARMVGRSDEVRLLTTKLANSRLITIVGPGGFGKTTLAVALAHDLLDAYAGAVLFVDLSMLSDPNMVAHSVASVLGLSVQTADPTATVTAYLRDKKLLLILDNCEHLIEAAAKLVASISVAAPNVDVIATSREALGTAGEWVHKLDPLALPSEDSALTAADAMTYPATRLFVEQALANGSDLEFSDQDAPIVAAICRKLDGVALAIELAARRVHAYGIQQTAALVDQRFALQWPGTRTAPPRQKSLNAMLDWSYSLLSEQDRVVLRRLAIFVGHFSIDAAQTVAASATIDSFQVLNSIESLVAKSMVSTHPIGAKMRYRLLDTTRSYVLGIRIDGDERAELAARHAHYCQQWLEQTAAAGLTLSNAKQRASDFADLNNVRAALEWGFGSEGNTEIGVTLAAIAAPVFFAMSLLTESQRWSQRAILALDEKSLGGRTEMHLQAALGLSLMWTLSDRDAIFSALNKSLTIARSRGDVLNQIRLFAPLHVTHMLIGEFKKALQFSEQIASLARTIDDPTTIALSHILSGYSLHFTGDLSGALVELEAALLHNIGHEKTPEQDVSIVDTLSNDAISAPILALAWSAAPSALARTLWLRGQPGDALDYVNQTIKDAESADHPVKQLVALIYAISVQLWNRDFDAAEKQIARFISTAESYSLKSHVLMGRCFKGRLAISRGEYESGIQLLQASLKELQAMQYELLTVEFNVSLAEALAEIGRFEQGISLIENTIQLVETNGAFYYMPEVLRVKANLLISSTPVQEGKAESCFADSITLSRRQGARAWELRTSIDLASRLASRGEIADARALLQPICEWFAEDANSADLRSAKSLLANWA